jgi:hypothetical protein
VIYSRTPFIRTLVIWIAPYPDRVGPWGKFFENSSKLTFLAITGCRIKYSTVLWTIELQIRRGRKFQTQVHTVNSNSQNSKCQCSLFSKKNQIIRILRISRYLSVPINRNKCSSTVLQNGTYIATLTEASKTKHNNNNNSNNNNKFYCV